MSLFSNLTDNQKFGFGVLGLLCSVFFGLMLYFMIKKKGGGGGTGACTPQGAVQQNWAKQSDINTKYDWPTITYYSYTYVSADGTESKHSNISNECKVPVSTKSSSPVMSYTPPADSNYTVKVYSGPSNDVTKMTPLTTNVSIDATNKQFTDTRVYHPKPPEPPSAPPSAPTAPTAVWGIGGTSIWPTVYYQYLFQGGSAGDSKPSLPVTLASTTTRSGSNTTITFTTSIPTGYTITLQRSITTNPSGFTNLKTGITSTTYQDTSAPTPPTPDDASFTNKWATGGGGGGGGGGTGCPAGSKKCTGNCTQAEQKLGNCTSNNPWFVYNPAPSTPSKSACAPTTSAFEQGALYQNYCKIQQ
jgi:hypothetical protein